MKETEKQFSIRLANQVLDTPGRDPDDDLSTLARQFLRAIESKWQPIETAPKDGISVLLLRKQSLNLKHKIIIGYFRKHFWHTQYACYYADPSHWMPLPEPSVSP